MRILLTNDDGIYAPGLVALRRVLARYGHVHVVAPMREQSAVGHAISISDPLRVMKVERDGEFFGYGVFGAPADCVKLATCELLPARPDLVVSGINLGANAGINVFYSGTVAAALEGAMFGMPSMAFSLDVLDRPNFEWAAQLADSVLQKVLENGFPPRVVLNVNIPPVAPSEVRGIMITRQAVEGFEDRFERRVDPRGREYFWIQGDGAPHVALEGTDVYALQKGYVSITPLTVDLTDHRALATMRDTSWSLHVSDPTSS